MADQQKKRGRKTVYTEEIATHILHELAHGKTLKEVCRQEGMPSDRTVRDWANENREGFSPLYARAREIGCYAMADDCIAIADNIEGDVQRDRLRVDTRKWWLAKALPKVFSEKVSLDEQSSSDLAERLHKLQEEAAANV